MFHNCKTEEDAKKLFRKLCLLIHPDKGGSNELMILLNEGYEICLKSLQRTEDKFNEFCKKQKKPENVKIFKGDERLSILDELFEILEDHEHFPGDFIISVSCFLENQKYITENQYNGLAGVLKDFKRRMERESHKEKS